MIPCTPHLKKKMEIQNRTRKAEVMILCKENYCGCTSPVMHKAVQVQKKKNKFKPMLKLEAFFGDSELSLSCLMFVPSERECSLSKTFALKYLNKNPSGRRITWNNNIYQYSWDQISLTQL